MENNLKHRFTVIDNPDYKDYENVKEKDQNKNQHTQPSERYSTNPIYEKLLGFREMQKKKRFTVDDLLKW